MTQQEDAPSKAVRQAIVRGVVVAAKAAKQSAKAVWRTDRTLPPPVDIEPHGLNRPALHRLGQERQRLLDEIKRQEIVIQDHPTTGTHMADDASEVTEQVTILALRRHLEGLLKEVERAMVRAERGLYGWCERCGHPISVERLQVMPWATLCIDCAQPSIRPAKAEI